MAISNTQIQESSSYSYSFSAESSLYTTALGYPDSYLVFTVYKNEDEYYVSPQLEQDSPFLVTFNEPSSVDVEYTVVYRVYSDATNSALVDASSIISFTVLEYQPTFVLPVVTCAELNKPFTFYPTNWFFNNNNLCPNTPINNGDYEVEYKRYEFNLSTSTYELKQTVSLTVDPADITNEEGGGEMQNPVDYAYQWTPTILAMVKIVVKINNCSEFVEKATVFPVCGSWKLRRLSCGSYRIYNYKNSNITYSLYEGVDPTNTSTTSLIKTEPVLAFSYVELPLDKDAIYCVVADGITQYIFNYCSIESCMLDLHKRILLDSTLCNECKLDKVLYQKALRLLPTYELWKKLLDKNWVYDVQYKTSDMSGELEALYDAQELYQNLKELCVECENTSKNCGCK